MRWSGLFKGRQAVCVFQAILTPGAFNLIAVRQAPTKTVGKPLRSLKAAYHGGDVDMMRQSGGMRKAGHAAVRFIFFGFGWVGVGFWLIDHYRVCPPNRAPSVRCIDLTQDIFSSYPVETCFPGSWENIPVSGKKSQFRQVHCTGKKQSRSNPVGAVKLFQFNTHSMHWQMGRQSESGPPQRNPRPCRHCSLCGTVACLECFAASGNLSGIHLWVSSFSGSLCKEMKSFWGLSLLVDNYLIMLL